MFDVVSCRARWVFALIPVIGFMPDTCKAQSNDAAVKPQPKQQSEAYQYILASIKSEREKLRTGICSISGPIKTRFKNNAPDSTEGAVSGLLAFDFKASKIRYDITRPGWVVDPSTLQSAGGDHVTAKHIKGRLTKQFADDGANLAFWHSDNNLCTIAPNNSSGERLASELFDVRATSLHDPVSLRDVYSFEKILASLSLQGRFATVRQNDSGPWVVEWNSKDQLFDHKFTLDVNPERGWSATSYKHEARPLNRPAEKWSTGYQFASQWKEVEGVWVPTRYTYWRGGIGAGFEESFDYQLDWKNVNQPVDPGMFSYTSFDLPDRVGVADVTKGETRYIREPKRQTAIRKPKQPSAWWPTALAAVAATVLAYGAYRHWGKRASPSQVR
jgi:hypothetical protein